MYTFFIFDNILHQDSGCSLWRGCGCGCSLWHKYGCVGTVGTSFELRINVNSSSFSVCVKPPSEDLSLLFRSFPIFSPNLISLSKCWSSDALLFDRRHPVVYLFNRDRQCRCMRGVRAGRVRARGRPYSSQTSDVLSAPGKCALRRLCSSFQSCSVMALHELDGAAVPADARKSETKPLRAYMHRSCNACNNVAQLQHPHVTDQWEGAGTPSMFCILEGSANMVAASAAPGRQFISEPPMQL